MHPHARTRREFLQAFVLGSGATALLSGYPNLNIWAQPRPKVLILGAGLAGLRCAMLLEEKGFEVTVIEGRTRIGGRLRTLTDLPGVPEEGGSVLGRSYARMRSMAERSGAELATPSMGHGPKTGACKACHAQGKVPDRRGGPGSLIVWRGRSILEGNWIDALPDLSEKERKVAPDRLSATYLQTANPLQDAEAWTRSEHADLDALRLDRYLASLGATPTALKLMDVAPNCPGLSKASAVWALRDAQRRAAGAGGLPLEFPGGSTVFIEKVAATLKSRPITGQRVTAIASVADKVVVHCANGATHEADYCISTLPVPTLAKIKFDPSLPEIQRTAFRELRYTPITRVYFRIKQPFWEQDGLPGTMWTDSVIERIFPMRNADGEVVSFVSHADGPGAVRLDGMSEEKRLRFAEQEFVRLRPAAKGAIEAVVSTSWANDEFAGGAYPFYAPGQVGRLRPATAQPWGRLHFAGEHTAVTQPGMEGAAESADRAVSELLARVG